MVGTRRSFAIRRISSRSAPKNPGGTMINALFGRARTARGRVARLLLWTGGLTLLGVVLARLGAAAGLWAWPPQPSSPLGVACGVGSSGAGVAYDVPAADVRAFLEASPTSKRREGPDLPEIWRFGPRAAVRGPAAKGAIHVARNLDRGPADIEGELLIVAIIVRDHDELVAQRRLDVALTVACHGDDHLHGLFDVVADAMQ